MKRKIILLAVILAAAFLTVDAWNYPAKHPEVYTREYATAPTVETEVVVQEFRNMSRSFEPARLAFSNPLMGYAVQAEQEFIDDTIQLVYIDITWREWESEIDQYNIEGIRLTNQIDRWKAEGKHAILRFICDYPTEERHMDIPDWLYLEIGKAGTYYHNSYGAGFSPDYSNSYFQKRHAAAVKALGEAFGNDNFISYIELGSLGHWGEWHVDYENGVPRLPSEQIRNTYVTPWQEAFPNAKIMMRRPFPIAAKEGYGLFNDVIGDAHDTQEWLSWVRSGGEYDQTTDPEDKLVPMTDFWKTSPSGGELTSGISMDMLMTENLSALISQIQESHTTFIGPKIASSDYTDAYNTLLDTIGYQFMIKQAELVLEDNQLKLTSTWTNNGVAPMYWDWPIYIYVKNAEQSIIDKIPVEIKLTSLLPNTELTNTTVIDVPASTHLSTCTFWVGIEDPMTLKPSVEFDMYTEQINGLTRLF